MLRETASQTAGPYLHIGMMPQVAGLSDRWAADWQVLARAGAHGTRIRLEGVVHDGTGAPVKDALVELWQADAHGRYAHPEDDRGAPPRDPAFRGFGRAAADLATGLWWFETVKPGAVPGPDGTPMAPHVALAIFARGINLHLVTRVYFADEAAANAADPVLRTVDPPARRATLLARPTTGDGGHVYRFDIHLQGPHETVFFDA